MKQHTDLIFKLEHQFTLFLQRAGVTRADLPPDQFREMRRAFYGGAGQMFFLMATDIPELPGKTYLKALDSFRDQLQEFWDKETEAHDKGLQEYAPQMRVACPCGWQGIVSDLIKPETPAVDDRCKCPTCGGLELMVPKSGTE